MKKRIITLLMLQLAIAFAAEANPIDMRLAREVGAKFISANTAMKQASEHDLEWITTYRTAHNDAAFYVFNMPKGFVIVSADDCATPILGYSNERVFTGDNIPIQLEEYLQHFVEQIQYGIENHLAADEATARQWELVRATGYLSDLRGTTSVAPLLTDTWNQNCYYNNRCPVDSNGPCGHVFAGCAATSFSQIMHYWGYPTTGTGSHSYTPEGYPTQTVNFGATTYDWNNMPDNLTSSSSSTQINAVATLMWHCGVAVEMNYSPYGSGANPNMVALAFVNYFNYSNDLTTASKDYYTNTQWLNMVKNDLNNGRPIHYNGWNSNGDEGHGFVCDGYDANDLLHFNWGWSGDYNDYYALDALTPPNGYNFSYSNFAIFNIHPNTPTTYQVNISANPSDGGTVSFGNKGDRTSTTYNFDDGTMMGWTSIDADGDTYGWESSTAPYSYFANGTNLSGTGHNASEAFVVSGSYSNNFGALTPNNYLVSPAKAAYSQIHFYACAQDASYAAEHFGVAVSTTTTSAFTMVQEWTLTAKGERYAGPRGNRTQGNWYEFTVDLSAYSGQDIWVAIRHFNCTDQFVLDIDDITLTTGGGGGGSSSSSATFNQGQSCTVTASPNSGYYFSNWTENGNVVSNSANYTFTVNNNRTLVANFTASPPQPQYTITISPNPSDGGLVAFGSKDTDDGQWYYYDNGTNSDAIGLTNGGSIYWGIMFPTGTYDGNLLTKISYYDYTAHSGQVMIYQGGTSAPATLLYTQNYNVSGSETVVEIEMAEPVALDETQNLWVVMNNYDGQYVASIDAGPGVANGSCISIDGLTWYNTISAATSGQIDGNWNLRAYIEEGANPISATYDQGQSCTVHATANSGYTFVNWTENGTQVSTNPNYTFTVTGNRILVANFQEQQQQYTINVSANPNNGGSVTGGGTYNQGQSCTVSATANTGYAFVNWTENGAQVSTNANYTFTVTGSRELVAHFTTQSYVITAIADPTAGGVVTGSGGYNYGETCTLTATANTGYTFQRWTKDGTQVSTNPTYSFTVTESATYTAHFNAQSYTITVAANPSNAGSVSGGGSYTYGQTCTVSASANDGYAFTNWTENGTQVSTDENYSFTVTGNRNLEANFAQNTHTIHATSGANGIITPSGTITVAHGASQSFSMIPDPDYTVQEVYIDGYPIGAMTSYTFTNVTDDHYIHVTFIRTEGIEESVNTVSVYPNPTQGELTLEGEGLRHVRIVNAYGQTVYNSDVESEQVRIDLSQMARGIYMMHIEAEGGQAVRKIVIE